MGVILWIVFGGLVGWVASVIMKTNEQQDIVSNVIVGIVGAFLGGWIMSFFGNSRLMDFNLYSFLVAVFGACLLLYMVRLVRR